MFSMSEEPDRAGASQEGHFDGALLLEIVSALPAEPLPCYPSVQVAGAVLRLELRQLPEPQFGPYSSKQRLYTVTNLVHAVLGVLGYLIDGIAGYPSMQQLHGCNGRLCFFLAAQQQPSSPTTAFRPQHVALLVSQHAFASGLQCRLLRDGTVASPSMCAAAGVQQKDVVMDLCVADYLHPCQPRRDGYPWPGDVVLKFRNLPQCVQRPGVVAAVLQAAGYQPQLVQLGDHHRDATTSLGDRAAGFPHRNIVWAIVRPLRGDSALSQLPRLLRWPGVPGLVKVTVHPAAAIAVGSHWANPQPTRYFGVPPASCEPRDYQWLEQRPFPGTEVHAAKLKAGKKGDWWEQLSDTVKAHVTMVQDAFSTVATWEEDDFQLFGDGVFPKVIVPTGRARPTGQEVPTGQQVAYARRQVLMFWCVGVGCHVCLVVPN